MKKLLILSISMLMLAGCNSIHENINPQLALYAKDVIKTYDRSIKESRAFDKNEYFIFESFTSLCQGMEEKENTTTEEQQLCTSVTELIEQGNVNEDDYKEQKEMIKNVIKTGNK